MGRIAIVVLLSGVALSCASPSRTQGTIPEEWAVEAWHPEELGYNPKGWNGPWVEREIFPCSICYSFHGDAAHEGGPAHVVPDHRSAIPCPHCEGVSRRTCPACQGHRGVVCDACEGFGIIRCPDEKCVLVRVKDVEIAPRTDSDRVRSLEEYDIEYLVPDLDWLQVPDRGEIRYSALKVCATCRSRGWIDCDVCEAGIRRCYYCRGAGLEPRPCPRCKGQGWIWPEHIPNRMERVRSRTP